MKPRFGLLVAAKLDVASGADLSAIAGTIAALGDTGLLSVPGGSRSGRLALLGLRLLLGSTLLFRGRLRRRPQ